MATPRMSSWSVNGWVSTWAVGRRVGGGPPVTPITTGVPNRPATRTEMAPRRRVGHEPSSATADAVPVTVFPLIPTMDRIWVRTVNEHDDRDPVGGHGHRPGVTVGREVPLGGVDGGGRVDRHRSVELGPRGGHGFGAGPGRSLGLGVRLPVAGDECSPVENQPGEDDEGHDHADHEHGDRAVLGDRGRRPARPAVARRTHGSRAHGWA